MRSFHRSLNTWADSSWRRPVTDLHLHHEASALVLEGRPLVSTTWPLRVESRANASRGESRTAAIIKAREVTAQRQSGALIGGAFLGTYHRFVFCAEFFAVYLVRLAPRKLDRDNLVAAFKGIQDGVADKLGVNDASSFVRYVHSQETGAYGVRAELHMRERLEDLK